MNMTHSKQEGTTFLGIAHNAWKAGAKIREDRRRFMRFAYGDQWGDSSTTPSGETLTDKEWAERSGCRPLTNNLIRQIVKTVVGMYRRNYAKGYRRDMRETVKINNLSELDTRAFEEFLISGCAIQRVVEERRPQGRGVWIDNVPPDRFFVNRFRDPRGNDIEIIGMLHDMSPAEVHSRFSMNGKGQVNQLPDENRSNAMMQSFTDMESDPFLTPAEGKCRLIEIWTLESVRALKAYDPVTQSFFMSHEDRKEKIKKINKKRLDADKVVYTNFPTVRWVCRWITTEGVLLDRFTSPYTHGYHPFAVKLYPLTDGCIHPFVEDIIDQQKYVNRMVTLIDHIMQSSAKGVLLFPEDRKPDDFSWFDIADLWSDCRGVIPYKSSNRTNDMPKQIVTSGATDEAHKLLSTQIDLMNRISGVSPSLAGQTLSPNASVSLYNVLRDNSEIALGDIFGSFESFIESRNYLALNTRTVGKIKQKQKQKKKEKHKENEKDTDKDSGSE